MQDDDEERYMFKPWMFLASGLLLGSLATSMYDSMSVSDGDGSAQISLSGQHTPNSTRSSQQSTESQTGRNNDRLLASSSPREAAFAKIDCVPGTLAKNADAASGNQTVGARGVLVSPTSAGGPEIDDLGQPASDLTPTPAERAEQEQRALEDEQILADAERIQLLSPAAYAIEVLPSEGELEYQRTELESQISDEQVMASQVVEPEPLLPE
jgi:hypothetical protein